MKKDEAALEHQAVAKQAAKKRMLELIKDAMDGVYKEKLSTLQTGQCNTEYNEARKNMTDYMNAVNPEALENFNFVSYS